MIIVDNAVTEIAGQPVHAPVSFCLAARQLGILTGGNGSGKTSLLRAILGELDITSGSVQVCGKPVRVGQTWRLTRSVLRSIPQFPMQPETLTIAEYLRAWHLYRPSTSPDINLDHVTQEMEQITDHTSSALLGTLSHGQQRLVDILLSIRARPRILLADEPLAGLSQHRSEWCVAQLTDFRRQGGALLVVAHKPEHQLWDADWTQEVYPA